MLQNHKGQWIITLNHNQRHNHYIPIPTLLSSVFSLISGWISAIKSSPPGAAFFTAAAATAAGFLWWPLLQSGVHLPSIQSCICSHTTRTGLRLPDTHTQERNHCAESTITSHFSTLQPKIDIQGEQTHVTRSGCVCPDCFFLPEALFKKKHSVPLKDKNRKALQDDVLFPPPFLSVTQSFSFSLGSPFLTPFFVHFHCLSGRHTKWMDSLLCESRIGNNLSLHVQKKVQRWPRIIFARRSLLLNTTFFFLNIFSCRKLITNTNDDKRVQYHLGWGRFSEGGTFFSNATHRGISFPNYRNT